jgi:putative colanic acid biosynthesis acetyltransferase WcaF
MRIIWFVVNALVLMNPLNPSSKSKVLILRLFGASIGNKVILKPGINVKYPWNIEIGNYSWIGERVWLDSITNIKIGCNTCISQGAYLCTGNHDWTDPTFSLQVEPITIEDGVWIGARVLVMPGVTVSSHSVIAAGSSLTKDTEPFMIYAGNPAVKIKKRNII